MTLLYIKDLFYHCAAWASIMAALVIMFIRLYSPELFMDLFENPIVTMVLWVGLTILLFGCRLIFKMI